MSSLLSFTTTIAKKAGTLVLKKSASKFKISTKANPADIVTEVDQAVEKLLIREIKKHYPDHGILAEESSYTHGSSPEDFSDKKYIWIIDPLDGTTNFAHGLKEYAVSIALLKVATRQKSKNFQYLEGEIIVGVVYAPALNEFFSAEKGKGAKLNGKKIRVSRTTKVSEAVFSTGFPATDTETNLPYFVQMHHRAMALRRFGAASLDLAYTAAGRFDGYWEFGLSPWDIAAGALLVKEAGGTVSDCNGQTLDLFGKDILATNGKIHKETIKTLATA